MMTLFCRFVCAVSGIYLLMITAQKLDKTKISLKQTILIRLSDCCFGVYIFQQFVLMLVERTELSKNLSPYIYPWVTFLIALFMSLMLTIFLRRTKVGSKIL